MAQSNVSMRDNLHENKGGQRLPMEGTLTQVKAFLVDDEVEIRKLLVRSLERMGLNVEQFSDANFAWKRIADGARPDIIISDINMPEMTGTELYAKIRSAGLDIPVILITGLPRENDERIQACGARWVIEKPFTTDKVTAAVTEALQSRIAPPEPEHFEGEIDVDRLSGPASWANSEQDVSRLDGIIAEGETLVTADERSESSKRVDAQIEQNDCDLALSEINRKIEQCHTKIEETRMILLEAGGLLIDLKELIAAFTALQQKPEAASNHPVIPTTSVGSNDPSAAK